ncbi:hypothetical protein E3Q22_03564 [Wallemia mellicola]|uniref:BZIP domain-containing protein n=1 Tax=Wallemia mellicola TaxID=1708541 RepID=A0A4T0M1L3_9BASI|nr:hypothetical protein E3Q22_03564 [Wallemia mellicola]TIC14659.1 hypothetical protein E3Q13_03573 [Wallemia mellicola]
MQDNLEIASAGQKQDTLLTGTQTSKQSRKERNRQNVANFRARQRIITQLQEEVYLLKKSKEYLEEERLFLNHQVFELQSTLYSIKYNMFCEEVTERII